LGANLRLLVPFPLRVRGCRGDRTGRGVIACGGDGIGIADIVVASSAVKHFCTGLCACRLFGGCPCGTRRMSCGRNGVTAANIGTGFAV